MNVVVCVKQVPDIEGRIVVEKGTISLQDSNLREVINPLDLLAIEEALRIRETDGEGKVTLVCVGSTSSEESLRKGIAMGNTRSIDLLPNNLFRLGQYRAIGNMLNGVIFIDSQKVIGSHHRPIPFMIGRQIDRPDTI